MSNQEFSVWVRPLLVLSWETEALSHSGKLCSRTFNKASTVCCSLKINILCVAFKAVSIFEYFTLFTLSGKTGATQNWPERHETYKFQTDRCFHHIFRLITIMNYWFNKTKVAWLSNVTHLISVIKDKDAQQTFSSQKEIRVWMSLRYPSSLVWDTQKATRMTNRQSAEYAPALYCS